MSSIWQILSILTQILAPLLSLFLVVIGRMIWNHENRITDLERSGTRQSRTLYGDERDAQQAGLAEDVKNLSDSVDELEESVSELRDLIKEMNDN